MWSTYVDINPLLLFKAKICTKAQIVLMAFDEFLILKKQLLFPNSVRPYNFLQIIYFVGVHKKINKSI